MSGRRLRSWRAGIWIPLVLLFALRDAIGAQMSPGLAPRFRRFHRVAGCWRLRGRGSRIRPLGVMACYLLAAVALVRRLLRAVLDAVAARLGRRGAGDGPDRHLPGSRGLGAALGRHPPGDRGPGNRRWKTTGCLRVHADPSLALHDQVLHTASVIAVIDDRGGAWQACWCAGCAAGCRARGTGGFRWR